MTTARQIVVAALAGAVIGAFGVSLFELFRVFVPVVPWTVPALLVVMAVGAWIYSHALPHRLEDHRAGGQEAVGALVVGKSMVMTGAILAGMHAVYVGFFVGQLAAARPAARVLFGSLTIVAALLLAVAGHRLEKACVIDDEGDDDHDNDADE